jgi:hypothetical protein
MKSLRYSACLLFLILTAVGLYGQESGSITGTVRDNTGAVVPGAEVNITSQAQGGIQKVTTNSNGDFLVAGLSAGTYDITITANGFKKYAATGVVLRVGQKARADATLQVGEITTEVTVAGEAVAVVETQSAEISGNYHRQGDQPDHPERPQFLAACDPGAGGEQSDGRG